MTKSERPNILFLVVDCLRADRAYAKAGGVRVPNLLDLARRGTAFDQAVSSATNTTPSFTSLLTSLYGFHHGVRSLRGYRLREDVVTLPEVLSAAGYETRAEVSGPLRREHGLDRGFARYRYRVKGRSLYSGFLGDLRRRIRREFREPWFLLLHLWALHRPRKIRPGGNRPEYGETIYDRSLSSLDERIGRLLEAVPRDRTLLAVTGDHGERMNEGDNDPENHRTAARISLLENWMENRHHARKRRRQRHAKRRGEEVGPLGGACHGFHIHEDLVRVPLILQGPGVPEGLRIPDPVRHVDIGPTLLEMAGVEAPGSYGGDGRSLHPLLRGERLDPAPAYVEATGQNLKSPTRWIAGVRTERLKYCRGLLDPTIPEELYDLAADPLERTNLAPDDARIDEMRRLFEEIAGDAAREGIDTSLSETEIEDLDETLRSLGYLD